MKFQHLCNVHKIWSDMLVIGKTIERDNKKYHIVGMTLADEVTLYIIEPYNEPENSGNRKKGVHNQRRILKENTGGEINKDSYLHCSEFYLGDQRLQVQGGSGSPLQHSMENYEHIQLFFDMLHAGWIIPDWLKDEDWENLQLITLEIADMKVLPQYVPEMPVTIKHEASFTQHIVEKTVTLTVGKSHSFCFEDHYGEKVQCYINNVTLIDMWKDAEERFKDPRYAEMVSEEQLQEMKKEYFEALSQNCPKGMCFIGVEYECSKNINLQFYSKEFLKSYPETHEGRAVSLFMRLKPDKETGTHNLPIKGSVIQTPVFPDTTKIPAELFLYLERVDGWEERI